MEIIKKCRTLFFYRNHIINKKKSLLFGKILPTYNHNIINTSLPEKNAVHSILYKVYGFSISNYFLTINLKPIEL